MNPFKKLLAFSAAGSIFGVVAFTSGYRQGRSDKGDELVDAELRAEHDAAVEPATTPDPPVVRNYDGIGYDAGDPLGAA